MFILPTLFDGTGNYTFAVQLDGTTFNFEFNWNDRQGAWFFNLLDIANTPLLMGRKVVLNLPMISEFVDPAFPLGDLMATDNSGQNIPPGLTDLGSRVIMVYFAQADLPSA